MGKQVEDSAEEIRRLQRCINDLVGLLALPAVWSGSEPSRIVEMLLDALLNVLSLEFVCARLNDPVRAESAEILRVADSSNLKMYDIEEMLSGWLKRDGGIPLSRTSRVGENISIFPVPLGIHGEIGMIVVGAERADFPTQTESLLLTVAANQASIGLRETALLSEQKRIANELDRRVAERTADLGAANDELRKEIVDRERAEKALRQSEQSLRLLFDNIAGLIAIMSATGELEAVNRQLSEYFGKTAEALKGWVVSDAVHPEDLPGVVSAWLHAVETASPYDNDHRLRRADGVYRWFHARGRPLLDSEGKIDRWYVLLTDIDDRRRAEEALHVRERELGLIANTIPALAWSAGPDGSAEFFNQHYLAYVGLPVKELQGTGWTAAVHPEDLGALISAWQLMMTTGKGGEVEARLRRFDGEYRWFLFRTNPMLDEAGNILKWYGTNSDIEDRKRAEEELRRSEGKWRSVFENSAVGVALTDLNGRFIATNPVYQKMLGYTQNELAQLSFLDITCEESLEHNRSLVDELITGKRQQFQIEKRYRRKDGQPVWAQNNVSLVPGTDRVPRFLMALSEDITQRKLSEEALARARSELSRVASITSLSVLTASIAHEVNQPLSGIITNAGTCLRMLSADPPNIEGARETVRRTIRDANRASDVITRLRTLYSKKELLLESMDLNDATREIAALLSSELHRYGLSLRCELADDLPRARGDRIQLQQVILNLVRNAADAMKATDDRSREIVVETERDGGSGVTLRVRDSGIGLTAQSADKIFEAFYTTKTDGMGIGLSISRSIIEGHHGRIWATANEGSGCTFSFAIPCAVEDSGEGGVDRVNPKADAA